MPELFSNTTSFFVCCLIVAGAQLIYATVGFGAGMFSIALMAMVLPDLAGAVTALYLLTVVTEVWVLLRAWPQAKARLLRGLLPTTAVGLWLGTELLVWGDVAGLKRVLGAVVAVTGAWFVYDDSRRWRRSDAAGVGESRGEDVPRRGRSAWLGLPVGLAAGTLTGMFGTGGPPVILLLKGHRLNKGAFRATLLLFFLLLSVLRGGVYLHAGLLTLDRALAAVWLLPASVAGMVLGIASHQRMPERHFATAVSVLLMILGLLLLAGAAT